MTRILNFTCPWCHSANILRDAFSAWNVETQQWELSSTYDSYTCDECGKTTSEPDEEAEEPQPVPTSGYVMIYDTTDPETGHVHENYYGYFGSVEECKKLFNDMYPTQASRDASKVHNARVCQMLEVVIPSNDDWA